MSEPDIPPAEPLSADRAATSRMCVATRQIRPVGELLRFVAGPDKVLVPDIRNRLPGRGVWVSTSRRALEDAIRRRLFGRSLKAEVTVPADLPAQVEKLLAADALQMLALVNKAGAVVTGFAKIEGMSGAIVALVQAQDGSPAEIERLRRHCRGRGPGGRDPAFITDFGSAELALSMGRELVIHAALRSHDASASFLVRARRLNDFRVGDPAPGVPAQVAEPAEALDSLRS